MIFIYSEGFSSKLKKSRLDAGYTQKEVEIETGISQSALTKYENGRIEPNIETLGILADFYQISTDWLIGIKNHDLNSKVKHGYISISNNIVNEDNGKIYIELTPEQIKKINQANDKNNIK